MGATDWPTISFHRPHVEDRLIFISCICPRTAESDVVSTSVRVKIDSPRGAWNRSTESVEAEIKLRLSVACRSSCYVQRSDHTHDLVTRCA